MRDPLRPPLKFSLPNIGLLVVVFGLLGLFVLMGSIIGPVNLLNGRVVLIMPLETNDAGVSVIDTYVDLGQQRILISLPLKHNCKVGDVISISHRRSIIGNHYGLSNKGCSPLSSESR